MKKQIYDKICQQNIMGKDFHLECFEVNNDQIKFRIPIAQTQKIIQGSLGADFTIDQSIPKFKAQRPHHGTIKNIIAIASGKGGVGKSTATYHLAQALRHMGAKVGILDTDIYGPSQALLFNIDKKPSLNEEKMMLPHMVHGIKVMTIGSLVDAGKAMMWRGPMISQAIFQLYEKTAWGELDYLLLDLPPGTGDIPLTVIQKLPITAAVMIGISHALSEYDVKKCTHLFQHLGTPILGQIINQSSMQCPHCQQHIALFNEKPEDILAEIPFDHSYQNYTDEAYEIFTNIGLAITQRLAKLPIATGNPFGKVVINHQHGE